MSRIPFNRQGVRSIGEMGSTREAREAKLRADNARLGNQNRTLSAAVAKQNQALATQAAQRSAVRS